MGILGFTESLVIPAQGKETGGSSEKQGDAAGDEARIAGNDSCAPRIIHHVGRRDNAFLAPYPADMSMVLSFIRSGAGVVSASRARARDFGSSRGGLSYRIIMNEALGRHVDDRRRMHPGRGPARRAERCDTPGERQRSWYRIAASPHRSRCLRRRRRIVSSSRIARPLRAESFERRATYQAHPGMQDRGTQKVASLRADARAPGGLPRACRLHDRTLWNQKGNRELTRAPETPPDSSMRSQVPALDDRSTCSRPRAGLHITLGRQMVLDESRPAALTSLSDPSHEEQSWPTPMFTSSPMKTSSPKS